MVRETKHLQWSEKLNICNGQIDAELRQELHQWGEASVTSVPTLGASRSDENFQNTHFGSEENLYRFEEKRKEKIIII